MKLKEFSPIKWRLLSIFFARSVAFVLDIELVIIFALNKFVVTAVSDLVNTRGQLQTKMMKYPPTHTDELTHYGTSIAVGLWRRFPSSAVELETQIQIRVTFWREFQVQRIIILIDSRRRAATICLVWGTIRDAWMISQWKSLWQVTGAWA